MGRVVVLFVVVLAGCSVGSHDTGPSGSSDPVVAGLAAVERGDGVSKDVAAAIRKRHPELDDLATFAAARATLAAGDRDGARTQLGAFVDRYPDSIWIGPARLLGGRLLEDLDDRHAAREWLGAARSRLHTGSAPWLAATLDAAVLAHADRDDEQALGLAQAIRRARPQSLAARRARRLCARIRGSNPELAARADQRLAEAETRLRENDAAGARAETSNGTDPAALWVRARAERALGMQTEAEATCVRLGHGRDALAPRALSTLGTWRWNRDNDAGAIAAFSDIVARFPDSEAASEAQYAVGRIHQEARSYGEAFEAYKKVAERWPATAVAAEARWRMGWVRYLAGDFRAAAHWFGRATRGGDRSGRPAAEYWRARSLEHAADPRATALFTHVADRHPTSYYGMIAATHLGRPQHRGVVADPPAPRFPAGLDGAHAVRARLFVDLGLRRLARRELDAQRAAAGDDRRLAQAYLAAGAPGEAIRVGQSLPHRPPLRALFPLAWWREIAPQAAASGIDPLLVTSLTRQESQFEPRAASAADAHGLMQLLLPTARRVADAAHLPPPTVASLYDPATNVALGTRLLRELIDRYHGSIARALAAYNAGEAAVAKWEARYGTRPEDEFVELISFRETRSYVRLVLRNWAIYTTLYAASPSASSLGNPPNAPFDMITMTSPVRADVSR